MKGVSFKEVYMEWDTQFQNLREVSNSQQNWEEGTQIAHMPPGPTYNLPYY